MRPSEYTDEQIIEAGKRLEGEGRSVTGFAIRKIIGGGNATRLKSIWEAHKQSQQVVEAEPVHELPVEVQDALESLTSEFISQFKYLVTTLNNKAVSTAERRVSEVIKAAQSEQEKAEAELSDAEIAVDELEEQIDLQNQGIEQQKKLVEEANKTIETQLGEITELNKQLAVSNQKVESLTDQLEQEQEENESRHQEIKRLLSQVEDLKADKISEADNASQWKIRANEYENKVTTLQQVKEELSEQLSNAKHDLDNANSTLEIQNSEIAKLKEYRKQQDDTITELREENLAKDKAASITASELKQSKTENSDIKKQIDKLQNELIKIASGAEKKKE